MIYCKQLHINVTIRRRNMRLFIIWGFSRLCFLVRVLSASKKLFSDMALDVGMHRVDRTTRASIGNRSLPLRLHHDRTWNSPLASPSAHCLISPSMTLCFMYASYSLLTLALKAVTTSWPSARGRCLPHRRRRAFDRTSKPTSTSSSWPVIEQAERLLLHRPRARTWSSHPWAYPWLVRSGCAQHQGEQDGTSWSDLATTPWCGYHQARTCCTRAASWCPWLPWSSRSLWPLSCCHPCPPHRSGPAEGDPGSHGATTRPCEESGAWISRAPASPSGRGQGKWLVPWGALAKCHWACSAYPSFAGVARARCTFPRCLEGNGAASSIELRSPAWASCWAGSIGSRTCSTRPASYTRRSTWTAIACVGRPCTGRTVCS